MAGRDDFFVNFGSNAGQWAKGLSDELKPAQAAVDALHVGLQKITREAQSAGSGLAKALYSDLDRQGQAPQASSVPAGSHTAGIDREALRTVSELDQKFESISANLDGVLRKFGLLAQAVEKIGAGSTRALNRRTRAEASADTSASQPRSSNGKFATQGVTLGELQTRAGTRVTAPTASISSTSKVLIDEASFNRISQAITEASHENVTAVGNVVTAVQHLAERLERTANSRPAAAAATQPAAAATVTGVSKAVAGEMALARANDAKHADSLANQAKPGEGPREKLTSAQRAERLGLISAAGTTDVQSATNVTLRNMLKALIAEGHGQGVPAKATKTELQDAVVAARASFDASGGRTVNNLGSKREYVSDDVKAFLSTAQNVLRAAQTSEGQRAAFDTLSENAKGGGQRARLDRKALRGAAGETDLADPYALGVAGGGTPVQRAKGTNLQGSSFGGDEGLKRILGAEATLNERSAHLLDAAQHAVRQQSATGNFNPYDLSLSRGVQGGSDEVASHRTAINALRKVSDALDKMAHEAIAAHDRLLAIDKELHDLSKIPANEVDHKHRGALEAEEQSLRSGELLNSRLDLTTPDFRRGLSVRDQARETFRQYQAAQQDSAIENAGLRGATRGAVLDQAFGRRQQTNATKKSELVSNYPEMSVGSTGRLGFVNSDQTSRAVQANLRKLAETMARAEAQFGAAFRSGEHPEEHLQSLRDAADQARSNFHETYDQTFRGTGDYRKTPYRLPGDETADKASKGKGVAAAEAKLEAQYNEQVALATHLAQVESTLVAAKQKDVVATEASAKVAKVLDPVTEELRRATLALAAQRKRLREREAAAAEAAGTPEARALDLKVAKTRENIVKNEERVANAQAAVNGGSAGGSGGSGGRKPPTGGPAGPNGPFNSDAIVAAINRMHETLRKGIRVTGTTTTAPAQEPAATKVAKNIRTTDDQELLKATAAKLPAAEIRARKAAAEHDKALDNVSLQAFLNQSEDARPEDQARLAKARKASQRANNQVVEAEDAKARLEGVKFTHLSTGEKIGAVDSDAKLTVGTPARSSTNRLAEAEKAVTDATTRRAQVMLTLVSEGVRFKDQDKRLLKATEDLANAREHLASLTALANNPKLGDAAKASLLPPTSTEATANSKAKIKRGGSVRQTVDPSVVSQFTSTLGASDRSAFEGVADRQTAIAAATQLATKAGVRQADAISLVRAQLRAAISDDVEYAKQEKGLASAIRTAIESQRVALAGRERLAAASASAAGANQKDAASELYLARVHASLTEETKKELVALEQLNREHQQNVHLAASAPAGGIYTSLLHQQAATSGTALAQQQAVAYGAVRSNLTPLVGTAQAKSAAGTLVNAANTAGGGSALNAGQIQQTARNSNLLLGQQTAAAAAQSGPFGGQGEAFAKSFFGTQGFYGRVINTVSTFIVRNIAAGLVFGVVNAVQDAVSQALETESTFVRVSDALESTGRQTDGLRTKLLGLSQQYGVALKDVYTTTAGLTGLFDATDKGNKGLEQLTETALQLQIISGGAVNATEAMTSLASILSSYGEGGDIPKGMQETAQNVSDVATVIQNQLGVNVEATIEGVARLSGLTAELGINFKTAAVYVAAISKFTGQSGAASGEQFSRILSSLQTGRVQAKLRGVPGVTEALQSGDYETGLKRLSSEWDNLTSSQKSNISVAIGGQRQAAAVAGIFARSSQLLQTLTAAENADGESKRRATEISKQFTNEMVRARAVFVNFFGVVERSGVLNPLLVALKAIVVSLGFLNSTFSRFFELLDSNPVTKFARESAFFMIGLSVTVGLVSRALSGMFAAIGRGVGSSVAGLRAVAGAVSGVGTAATGAAATGGVAGGAKAEAAAGRAYLATQTAGVFRGRFDYKNPSRYGSDPFAGPNAGPYAPGPATRFTGPDNRYGRDASRFGTQVTNAEAAALSGRARFNAVDESGTPLTRRGRFFARGAVAAEGVSDAATARGARLATRGLGQAEGNLAARASFSALGGTVTAAGAAADKAAAGFAAASRSATLMQAGMIAVTAAVFLVLDGVTKFHAEAAAFEAEAKAKYDKDTTRDPGLSDQGTFKSRSDANAASFTNRGGKFGFFAGFSRAFSSTYDPRNYGDILFGKGVGQNTAARNVGDLSDKRGQEVDKVTLAVYKRLRSTSNTAGALDANEKDINDEIAKIRTSNDSAAQKDTAIAALEAARANMRKQAESLKITALGLSKTQTLATDQIAALPALVQQQNSTDPRVLKQNTQLLGAQLATTGLDATDYGPALQKIGETTNRASRSDQSIALLQKATTASNAHLSTIKADPTDQKFLDAVQAATALQTALAQAMTDRLNRLATDAASLIDLDRRRGDYSKAAQDSQAARDAVTESFNSGAINSDQRAAQLQDINKQAAEDLTTAATHDDERRKARIRDAATIANIELNTAQTRLNNLKLEGASQADIDAATDQVQALTHSQADTNQQNAQAAGKAKLAGSQNELGNSQGTEELARKAVIYARAQFGEKDSRYLDALTTWRQTKISTVTTIQSEAAATRQLNIAKLPVDDVVGIAQATLADAVVAQKQAEVFGKNSSQYINATTRVVEAQKSVVSSLDQVVSANSDLSIALADASGNTLESAALKVAAAQTALDKAKALSGGKRTPAVIQAEGAVATSKAAQRDALVTDAEGTIDFNQQMGYITAQEAAKALQNILDTANLTQAQRRDLMTKIKGLQDNISGAFDSQFNLGEIRVPTVYEVRKSLGVDQLTQTISNARQEALNSIGLGTTKVQSIGQLPTAKNYKDPVLSQPAGFGAPVSASGKAAAVGTPNASQIARGGTPDLATGGSAIASAAAVAASAAATAALGGVTQNLSAQGSTVTIEINGADVRMVQQIIRQYLGSASTMTKGTVARKGAR